MAPETAKRFVLQQRVMDGALVLDLSGPLNQEGGETVMVAVAERKELPARLVLNFAAVGPINSAGLGGVLCAVRQMAQAAVPVAAYGLSDHFRKVFYVMGLTQYIRLCPDEAAALGPER